MKVSVYFRNLTTRSQLVPLITCEIISENIYNVLMILCCHGSHIGLAQLVGGHFVNNLNSNNNNTVLKNALYVSLNAFT